MQCSHRLVITETRSYKHTTDAPPPSETLSSTQSQEPTATTCTLQFKTLVSWQRPRHGYPSTIQLFRGQSAPAGSKPWALPLSPPARSLSPRDNFSGGWFRAWSVMPRAVSAGAAVNHVLPALERRGRRPQRGPQTPACKRPCAPAEEGGDCEANPGPDLPAVVETTPTTEQAFSPCLLCRSPALK